MFLFCIEMEPDPGGWEYNSAKLKKPDVEVLVTWK